MNQKRWFFRIALLGFFIYGCSSSEFILPDHPHIQYTGRVDFEDSRSPVLSWPGTYFRVTFEGPSLTIWLDDSSGETSFDVILNNDYENGRLIDCQPGKRAYQIAYKLPDSTHQALIFRRNEAITGPTKFLGIELSPGKKTRPPGIRPERRIEFYGNSITCGMGNEAHPDSTDNNMEEENNFWAYGAITARTLNAEYVCIAKSGIGILISWFDLIMPDYYNRLDPGNVESHWDFDLYDPHVVVVNLLQNDSWLIDRLNPVPDSAQIIDAYVGFIRKIRAEYSDAEIICALGIMDAIKEGQPWPGYVQNAAVKMNREFHDDKVSVFIFSDQDYYKHPRVEHHKKMAGELSAYIKNRMNW